MLLAAFSCLPIALQARVAARLQQDLVIQGGALWTLSAQECQQLLVGLDPVLNWCPIEDEIRLPENEWQRMLQYARLTPGFAGKLLS